MSLRKWRFTEAEEYLKILMRLKVSKKSGDKLEKELLDAGVKFTGCHLCQENAMAFADDIIFDTTIGNERIYIAHLSGLKCTNCDAMGLDEKSARIVEDAIANAHKPFFCV